MCKNTDCSSSNPEMEAKPAPQTSQLKPPSMLSRYTCVGILAGFFAVWTKYAFVPESEQPGIGAPMHSYEVPLALTVGYLVSLPLLRFFVEKYLSKITDLKLLLTESMILYNVAQVLLNGWMVYRIIDALVNQRHPFIGDISTVATGAPFAVYIHYMDKYLEFFDTYFMVLRGKMDQVSFLHVYHHCTIAWAWWAAITLWPGGDSYFGALLNSWIHVMMYSYYALSLLKIRCPWKKYLTQAQLLQFTTVVIYTIFCYFMLPKDEVQTKHYVCIIIQICEMVSLFVLFFLFYRKSYGKKNRKAAGGSRSNSKPADADDQCQKAVAAITSTTTEVIGNAAKDANKVASAAKKTLMESTSRTGVL